MIRPVGKPKRQDCGFGIHAFIVIGIWKRIEITIGIPLQGNIKSYPKKKEPLNYQSHRVTRLLHMSGVVWLDI